MSIIKYYTEVNNTFKTGYHYNDGSSTNIDWSLADFQEYNLETSCGLSFSGATAGQKLTLLIKQNGTESHYVGFPNNCRWSIETDVPSNFTQDSSTYSLDPGFHPSASSPFLSPLFDARVIDFDKDPSGIMYFVGQFTDFDGNVANSIASCDISRYPNQNFNSGTGFNDKIFCVKVQPDGKILLGGNFTSYNGNTANYIVRLNKDGSIDGSFTVGSGFDSTVLDIELLSDGSIIAVGNFTLYNGDSANGIVKLSITGVQDNTFKANRGAGFISGIGKTITIQTGDRILVGGSFTDFNGNTVYRILRLDSSGLLDGTFKNSGGFDADVFKIVELSTGELIVGGQFTTFDPSGTPATSNYLCKLDSNGEIHPDTTTNSTVGFDADVYCILEFHDGRIIVSGSFTTYESSNTATSVCFLNSDLTFNSNIAEGVGFSGAIIEKIALIRNNKLVVTGTFTQYDITSSINNAAILRTDGLKYTRLNFIYNSIDYLSDVS